MMYNDVPRDYRKDKRYYIDKAQDILGMVVTSLLFVSFLLLMFVMA